MARIFQSGFEEGTPAWSGSAERDSKYGSLWNWKTSAKNVNLQSGVSATTRSTLTAYAARWYIGDNSTWISYFWSLLSSTYSELYSRCYFYVNSATSAAGSQVLFALGSTTASSTLFDIRLGTGNGNFLVYVGGVSVATLTNVFAVNIWHRLECYTKVHSSAGAFTIKVDGVTVLEWTGNSGSTKIGTIRSGATSAGSHKRAWSIDDVALNDTTGSVNNGYPGEGVIVALKPKGAGNYSQWTPSAGSNYENVDDLPLDSNTTYNESDTTGDIDTYDLKELVADKGLPSATTVSAVSICASTRYIDSGGNMALMLRSGSTDDEGASQSLNSAYLDSLMVELHDINPFTGSGWTNSDVDALEAGIKVK